MPVFVLPGLLFYSNHLTFLVPGLDLKNMLLNITNPNACQKVITVNPNIIGINQFHNHTVTCVKINTINNTSNISPIFFMLFPP